MEPQNTITQPIIDTPKYIDNSYDILDTVVRSDDNLRTEYIKIDPIGGSSLTGRNAPNTVYEWEYLGSEYYDLSHSYFTIEGKFKRVGAAQDWEAGDIAATGTIPVNNIADHLFNRGELYLGNEMVEEIAEIGAVSTVLKLVYASSEWVGAQGGDCGFMTTEEKQQKRVMRLTAADALEAGAAVPSYFSTKLSLGMLTDGQPKVLNTKMKIRLYRQDQAVIYKGAAGRPSEYIVDKMTLNICVRKPQLDLQMKLDSTFAQNIVRYNFNTARSNWVNLTNGVKYQSVPLGTFLATPHTVIVCPQLNNKYTIAGDASLYDNLSITSMELKLNEKRVGLDRLDIDFSTGQFQDALMLVRNAVGGPNNYVKGSNITYKNFASQYPLFVFNIANNNQGLPEVNHDSCKIDLNVNFGGDAANPANARLLVIYLFNKVVEKYPASSSFKTVFGH